MEKEILEQINELCKCIDRLVRENQPEKYCDYTKQKDILELHLAVLKYMRFIEIIKMGAI